MGEVLYTPGTLLLTFDPSSFNIYHFMYMRPLGMYKRPSVSDTGAHYRTHVVGCGISLDALNTDTRGQHRSLHSILIQTHWCGQIRRPQGRHILSPAPQATGPILEKTQTLTGRQILQAKVNKSRPQVVGKYRTLQKTTGNLTQVSTGSAYASLPIADTRTT